MSAAEQVTRAVLNLVMAGSTSSSTDVAVTTGDVAAVTGLPLAVVNAELDALVACGAADALTDEPSRKDAP